MMGLLHLNKSARLNLAGMFGLLVILLTACSKEKDWGTAPDVRVNPNRDTPVVVITPVQPPDTVGGNPFKNVPGITSVRIGSLTSERAGMASLEAEGKLYFAGGWGPTALVDIMDTASGALTTKYLTQARHSIAAAHCNGLIFFAGGFTSNDFERPTDVVDILDLRTGEMRTDKLSISRGRIAAAVLGDLVIFAGGTADKSWKGMSRVDIYDTRNRSWSTHELQIGGMNMKSSIVDGQVIFSGGRDRTGQLSSAVEIYDGATGKWTVMYLKSANANAEAAVVNGSNVYFFPGCRGFVEVFNGLSWQWSSLEYTGSESFSYMSGSSNQKIALFGGFYCNYVESRGMIIFDLQTNRFSPVLDMPFSFSDAGVISVGNHFYVAGGSSEDLGRNLSGIFRVTL
jgi:hypothetical protein